MANTKNQMRIWALLLLVAGCLNGCSLVTAPFQRQMGTMMADAFMDSSDPQLVREAIPSYLLLMDGLVDKSPRDAQLLQGAAMLYSLYGGFLMKDESRAQQLTAKSLDYALRAVRALHADAPDIQKCGFDDLRRFLSGERRRDLPALYTLGSVWAEWILVRQDDLAAAADLARVESIMTRVLELDEAFRDGGAHLYLGALAAMTPASMGGKPEEGRQHFERAIALSKGKNLMAKVMYARMITRTQDPALYKKMLNDITSADPKIKGYTLMNVMAQQQARELLQEESK